MKVLVMASIRNTYILTWNDIPGCPKNDFVVLAISEVIKANWFIPLFPFQVFV